MSKIKNIVQASAEHIRIVTLAKGDVYKRLAPDGYGSTKRSLSFGVVTDVLSNGDESAVCAIEYQRSFGAPTAKIVTLTADEDAVLYPATPDEVRSYFGELAEALEQAIATKTRELAETRQKLERVMELAGSNLTTPATEPVEG